MSELLGTFEQAVLLAVVKLANDAYGRAILRQVQRSIHREVAAGAVYATLDRLEEKGLISSRLASGTPVRGGRRRRAGGARFRAKDQTRPGAAFAGRAASGAGRFRDTDDAGARTLRHSRQKPVWSPHRTRRHDRGPDRLLRRARAA